MARMVEKIVAIRPSAMVSTILPASICRNDSPGRNQSQPHEEVRDRLGLDSAENIVKVFAGNPITGWAPCEEIGVDNVIPDFERISKAREQADRAEHPSLATR